MTEHKHAEVLRAIADGKEVQFQVSNGIWVTPIDGNPIRNEDWEWRIKPEHKPDVVLYYGISKDRIIGSSNFHYYDGPYDYGWKTTIKVTWDGETNEPKTVELIK